METTPQRHPAIKTEDMDTPPARLLPSGRNKVERISTQTRGIFGDVSSWVELRLKLFQVEIQERVQEKLNETVIKIAPVAAGAIAGLFALVTLALFVGWWLGHPAWGFLVVTVLLGLITAVLLARKKRFEKDRQFEAATQATVLSSNGASN